MWSFIVATCYTIICMCHYNLSPYGYLDCFQCSAIIKNVALKVFIYSLLSAWEITILNSQ